MARKPKFWKLREDYRSILKETKRLFPTLLAHVKTKRIALAGIYNRRYPHMAFIQGNRYPYALLCPDYDYMITYWSSRFDGKPHSYKIYVTLHELAHIPQDGFKTGSKGFRRCVTHDIQDFEWLRKVYGISLEKIEDVMKGESHLVDPNKVHRFPREEAIK